MSEHQGEMTTTISAKNRDIFPCLYAYSTGVMLISQVGGGMK